MLAAALAMSPNVADPDLWGHVQFGRDVLKSGEIAATTSYSYTAEGYRWINHENLSEITMAIIADSVGPLGLVIGKFLLSLFVLICILRWNLKNGVGLTASCIVTLLVGANLGYHWSIRPQLSSFIGFTMMILLLQYCFTGWRGRWHLPFPKKWFAASDTQNERLNNEIDIRASLGYDSTRMRLLWVAPIIFLIWANSHGGFVAGLCIYTAYLGSRAFEAICRGGRFGWNNAGWGLARRMALMATVAVLITFLNPYGPRLHLWLLESLGNPRPEISDWSSRELFSLVGMKLWVLVAIAIFALSFSKQKWDATQLLLLAITLWQSLSHFRHVPFFVILCGFWIGPHLHSSLQRFATTQRSIDVSKFGRRVVQAGLAAALVVISAGLFNRLSDVQVFRNQFPVDAIDFMRQNELHGRLVVTYDWAQYSIFALCSPEQSARTSQIAFDGRFRTCYPQSIVDMHFDFLYGHAKSVERFRSPDSPPCDPSRVLNYKQPELVLLRRRGELTEQHMEMNTDRWVLLYQDAISQVWGARHVYANSNSPWYLPPEDRIVSNRMASDCVTWPAVYPTKPPVLDKRHAVEIVKSIPTP